MKRLIATSILLSSLCASAAQEQPILSKYNSSGYVMPEWDRSESCQLFRDKVLITKNFGVDNQVTEVRSIRLNNDLSKVIAKAAAEDVLVKPNNMCDAPATVTRAFFASDDGEVQAVQLYSTGGCGSDTLNRQGTYTRILKDLIDTYCPKTHRP